MSFRIGQFLLLLGLLAGLLFYASFASNQTDENFLGWAFIFLVGGVFLMMRDRKPGGGSAERFRGIRAFRQRQAQRRKEAEEKRKAKEAERLAKKRKR